MIPRNYDFLSTFSLKCKQNHGLYNKLILLKSVKGKHTQGCWLKNSRLISHFLHILLLYTTVSYIPIHNLRYSFLFSALISEPSRLSNLFHNLERAIKIHLLSVLIWGEFIILIISSCTKDSLTFKRKY